MSSQSTLKAAFWMVCSICCLLLMTWSGRQVTADIPVVQAMEIRSVVGLVLLYPLVHMQGGVASMRTNRFRLHFMRNLAHYSGQYCWVAALSMIPLAQLVAIEFTAPIWTALLAVTFLGERMTAWKSAAMVLGLIGVVIIVRPGAHFNPGQFVVLFAAVAFAISFAATKSLTRTDSVVTIIFWMLVIQSAFGLLPAIWLWQTPQPGTWPWLLGFAFGGSYAHYCMARAMTHADATVVMPMDFLRVPATALLGWLAYGETIDMLTVIGAVTILSGNLLNLIGRPKSAEPTPAP
jgi:drug/metabolite transporter (DMT)-like permease